MTILSQLNSPVMYLICGTIIAFVAVVCVFFAVRAWRAGVAIGMTYGKTLPEAIDIGSMLKRERLYQNLSQKTVSERSGISESALKNLEAGRGASLSTFIQVCRTLGKDEWIMRLGPTDAVSVEDYAKRGGRPRVRAASSRKEVR